VTHTSPPSPAEGGRQPGGYQRSFLWLPAGCLGYAAGLALLTWGNAAGPERWWWSSLNLYLPQWLWALPGLALLAAAGARQRRWACLPALGIAWVAGPLMGLCWPAPRAEPVRPGAVGVRLMTYNVKWARRSTAIVREIAAARPDVLLLQDARPVLETEVAAALRGYSILQRGQYLVASRFPLETPEVRPFPGVPGRSTSFQYFRCRARVGAAVVSVYNVHLLTPRAGLLAVRHEGDAGLGDLESNTAARLFQAAVLAEALREERGPVLLGGDLNAPVQSMVCRALAGAGLADAFSAAGRGYGYTYGHLLRLRHSYLRIDHLMTSPHWEVLDCWTGGADGSDHRPVIADLRLH
jgi:endonuclease/exonuclease/phosphatase (EEP) superfamily protein YafD